MKIKNKGKVHPSPPPLLPPSSSTAALHLLPATVLPLASVLPPNDLQVLSYLLSRSLHLSNPTHSSSLDCDCFDCYTFYWLRWDSSPNRDLIHRVIDAFEDHLSSSSAPGKPKVGRRRRGGKDRNFGGRDKRQLPEISSVVTGALEAGDVVVAAAAREGNDDDNVAIAAAEEGRRSGGGGGEHRGLARKVLPDLLGILNSRLWNLWSPDV